MVTTAKIIAGIGLIAMAAVLVYGFTVGDFSVDGAEILSNPWGIVSIVDLYTGFLLFSAWIIYREQNKLAAAGWMVLMIVLGFFAGSLYTLLALFRSQGSWRNFWLGKHA